MKLNDSYKVVKNKYRWLNIFLILNEVYSIIKQEEEHREILMDSVGRKKCSFSIKKLNRTTWRVNTIREK